jgi:hypothetical protein
VTAANLTWVPQSLLSAPNVNTLIDAATAYLYLYPLVQARPCMSCQYLTGCGSISTWPLLQIQSSLYAAASSVGYNTFLCDPVCKRASGAGWAAQVMFAWMRPVQKRSWGDHLQQQRQSPQL